MSYSGHHASPLPACLIAAFLQGGTLRAPMLHSFIVFVCTIETLLTLPASKWCLLTRRLPERLEHLLLKRKDHSVKEHALYAALHKAGPSRQTEEVHIFFTRSDTQNVGHHWAILCHTSTSLTSVSDCGQEHFQTRPVT